MAFQKLKRMLASRKLKLGYSVFEFNSPGLGQIIAAATKGLDCHWIGHFDLSCSLGIPGEFDHPDFKKASARVKRAARKHNKALGRLAGTPAETIALHKRGCDLLCYSGDLWIYQQALIPGIDEIRAKCKA